MALIGEPVDLSYQYEHLGEGAAALTKLLKGGPAMEMLRAAERPAIILGPGMLSRPDRAVVLQQARISHPDTPRLLDLNVSCVGRATPAQVRQSAAAGAP